MARAFALAWLSIPGEDRRTLIRYWRGQDDAIDTFLPRVIRHPAPGHAGTAWAACEDDGCTLVFRASLTEALPVEALTALVLHELAHSLQAALGLEPDEADAHEMGGPWLPEWTAIVDRVLSGKLV